MRKAGLYILLILVSACQKENAFDCFKSTGTEIKQMRDVGSFRHLIVYDKIDVNFFQGSEYLVEVIAGRNLMGSIKTENKDGVLSISNNNKCNFVRGYKRQISVNITVPHIDRVENQGVGTVRFKDDFVQDSILVLAENSGDTYIHGNILRVKTGSHGNGDIYLYGQCDTLFVYMYGTNSLKAKEMTAKKYIFVETASVADAHVRIADSGRLEYNIWRSGNIYYRGNPSVIKDVSNSEGSGKLIKEE